MSTFEHILLADMCADIAAYREWVLAGGARVGIDRYGCMVYLCGTQHVHLSLSDYPGITVGDAIKLMRRQAMDHIMILSSRLDSLDTTSLLRGHIMEALRCATFCE